MNSNRRSLILVHPPQQGLLEGFSSGLVALANYVESHLPSVDVRLLDLGLVPDHQLGREIFESLAEIRDDIFVGISTTTASYQAAIRVAESVKSLRPHAIVVLGGHHASAQDDVVLKHHAVVDFVIRGEGERALAKLLTDYPAIDAVPNLSYRASMDILRNSTSSPIGQHELDSIAPIFRGWGIRSAPGKFDHTTYVSARGCPLRCAFCAVANERIRAKSITSIVGDLRVLVGDLGYRRIAIEDNFFAHSPKRTIALCRALEELQKEMSFSWDCQTRVESCRRADVVDAMARAGCEAVYLGVESLDPEHLCYLNKTSSPDSYLRLLHERVAPCLLESQIDCYINLQLGLPSEAPRHRQNTIHSLRRLATTALAYGKQITVFPQLHVVYPGTHHFRAGLVERRFGLDGASVFERFTQWEVRQQPILRWLGEQFAHGTGGIPEGLLYKDRLAQGEFEVNPAALLDIVNYLSDLSSIYGITVFKYGAYLSENEDKGVPASGSSRSNRHLESLVSSADSTARYGGPQPPKQGMSGTELPCCNLDEQRHADSHCTCTQRSDSMRPRQSTMQRGGADD